MKQLKHYSHGGGEDVDWVNGSADYDSAPVGYNK